MIDQYMTHVKRPAAIGRKAWRPTPPGGRGWRLVSVAVLPGTGSMFMFFWHRRVKREPHLVVRALCADISKTIEEKTKQRPFQVATFPA